MTIQKTVVQDGDEDLKDKTLDNAGAEVADDKKDNDEDKKLSEVVDPLLEGDEEEEVTIKRGALKKLHSVKENYKTVAVAAKKSPKVEPKQPVEDKKEEYVTVASVQKKNEKDAIVRATVVSDSDDEDTQVLKKEIDENWDSIKAFYTGKGGKDDPNAIYEDILDAHAAWKRRYGSAKDTGTKTAAELAASRGVIGSSPKNKSTGERKRILPRSGSPKESWYPKKEN